MGRDPGGGAARRAGRDRRGISRSRHGCLELHGGSGCGGGGSDLGPGRNVAVVLARSLDVEGRLQGGVGPAQARRDHLVPPGKEAPFLAPFAVRALPGVGPKAEQRLAAAGVKTIGGLAALADGELRVVLPGTIGPLLRDRALGIDPRDLELQTERISLSTEETFERDISDLSVLHAEIRRMAAEVAAGLVRRQISARTVTTSCATRTSRSEAGRRRSPRRSTRRSGSPSSRPAPRPGAARPAGCATARRSRRLRADGAPAADVRRGRDSALTPR